MEITKKEYKKIFGNKPQEKKGYEIAKINRTNTHYYATTECAVTIRYSKKVVRKPTTLKEMTGDSGQKKIFLVYTDGSYKLNPEITTNEEGCVISVDRDPIYKAIKQGVKWDNFIRHTDEDYKQAKRFVCVDD